MSNLCEEAMSVQSEPEISYSDISAFCKYRQALWYENDSCGTRADFDIGDEMATTPFPHWNYFVSMQSVDEFVPGILTGAPRGDHRGDTGDETATTPPPHRNQPVSMQSVDEPAPDILTKAPRKFIKMWKLPWESKGPGLRSAKFRFKEVVQVWTNQVDENQAGERHTQKIYLFENETFGVALLGSGLSYSLDYTRPHCHANAKKLKVPFIAPRRRSHEMYYLNAETIAKLRPDEEVTLFSKACKDPSFPMFAKEMIHLLRDGKAKAEMYDKAHIETRSTSSPRSNEDSMSNLSSSIMTSSHGTQIRCNASFSGFAKVCVNGKLPSEGTISHHMDNHMICNQHIQGSCPRGSKCHKCHAPHTVDECRRGGARKRAKAAQKLKIESAWVSARSQPMPSSPRIHADVSEEDA